ncbi:MAG: cytochrome c oxidase subunit I, partial [Gammaproteobacteria bacterium]|nr:cytochrome c oxidase subunit I [Gammaproteobacteria bacterium]
FYNVTFIAMFWVGTEGAMNRRVADYPADLVYGNVIVSLAAFMLGAIFLVFTFNMVYSWIRGQVASANPWNAKTLEWQTSSPPPVENFPVPPVVTADPYGYGEADSEHARFEPTTEPSSPGGDG